MTLSTLHKKKRKRKKKKREELHVLRHLQSAEAGEFEDAFRLLIASFPPQSL